MTMTNEEHHTGRLNPDHVARPAAQLTGPIRRSIPAGDNHELKTGAICLPGGEHLENFQWRDSRSTAAELDELDRLEQIQRPHGHPHEL